MESIRKINSIEKATLDFLVKQASLQLPYNWDENLFVQRMNDGGMGSFLIFQNRSDFGIERKFGNQASEYQFNDDDGIAVLVTLNLDDQNKLFEVDVWKANYTPVINFKVPT
jgi:hypothetical protein